MTISPELRMNAVIVVTLCVQGAALACMLGTIEATYCLKIAHQLYLIRRCGKTGLNSLHIEDVQNELYIALSLTSNESLTKLGMRTRWTREYHDKHKAHAQPGPKTLKHPVRTV